MNALFTTKKSIYNTIAGINCYDINKNALTCKDKTASIYHPPCRAWGQLKHLAKPRRGEKMLAIWSILRINRYGGVLEHPANSEIFKKYKFLMNQGIVIDIKQVWFGHPCEKPTKIYIRGIGNSELPGYDKNNKAATHKMAAFRGKDKTKRNYDIKQLSSAKRELTPERFAYWLIKICQIIESKKTNGKLAASTHQQNLKFN